MHNDSGLRFRRLIRRTMWFLMLAPLPVSSVLGADSLIVQSREVDLDSGADTLRVRIVNTRLTRAVVIPFAVRNVEPGCLPSAMSVSLAERLEDRLTQITVTNQYSVKDGTCTADSFAVFSTPHITQQDTFVDVAVQEWGMLFACYGYPEAEYLPAGSDTSGSVVLAFTPPPVFGSFEIDTTCVGPANHVFFMDGYPGPIVIRTPVFVKGVVRMCDCRFHGDLDGSGGIEATDLAILIDWVFFSVGPPPSDPTCPHVDRGDFNCDGVDDAMDLALMIDHVNYGGPGPCDPCACDPYPSGCPE